jgi:hypothetical protein
MIRVREKSRFGPCYALGELIGETNTDTSIAIGLAPPSSAKARRAAHAHRRLQWHQRLTICRL